MSSVRLFSGRRRVRLSVTCLLSSGTSVGGFLFAMPQRELIELSELDGCLLIVGALALNVVPCAGPMVLDNLGAELRVTWSLPTRVFMHDSQ